MKNLFFAPVLIFICCLAKNAQTTASLTCPTIVITGSPSHTQFGETLIFTAKLSEEAEKFDPKYNWTISNGIIIEGQGTLTIKVLTEVLQDSYRATIDVIGMPKTCSNKITETAVLDHFGDPLSFDQFSVSAPQINKFRLDKLLKELQRSPATTAYIIENFKRKTPQNIIRLKLQKLDDYLFKIKGIKKDRIVISINFSDEDLTQIYIVPLIPARSKFK